MRHTVLMRKMSVNSTSTNWLLWSPEKLLRSWFQQKILTQKNYGDSRSISKKQTCIEIHSWLSIKLWLYVLLVIYFMFSCFKINFWQSDFSFRPMKSQYSISTNHKIADRLKVDPMKIGYLVHEIKILLLFLDLNVGPINHNS